MKLSSLIFSEEFSTVTVPLPLSSAVSSFERGLTIKDGVKTENGGRSAPRVAARLLIASKRDEDSLFVEAFTWVGPGIRKISGIEILRFSSASSIMELKG